MGFLKDFFKGFTMNTEEVFTEARGNLYNHYKETEDLHFIDLLTSKAIYGVKIGYSDAENIILFNDRIRFSAKATKNTKDIMFDDIVSVELMTDMQIEEKSKVGQMMVIGMFALATKKQTVEVMKRRLVINVCEEDINYSIIVDTIFDALDEAKKLNKLRNEYKENIEKR